MANDLVHGSGVYDLSVRESVVGSATGIVAGRVGTADLVAADLIAAVLGSQLLLTPVVPAEQSPASFFAPVPDVLSRLGFFLVGAFLSEHFKEVGPTDPFFLTVG